VNRSLQRAWLSTLTASVALLSAWVGLAAHGLDRTVELLGAVAIIAALAAARRSRPAAIALLLLGALPPAILIWWSIVTPVLAVLCLLLGWPRTGPRPRTTITRRSLTGSARGGRDALQP
jgi:hypothetical protein